LYYDDLWLSDPAPFFAELIDVVCRQVPRSIFHHPRPVFEQPIRDKNPLVEPT
jgi:hypothetical protein